METTYGYITPGGSRYVCMYIILITEVVAGQWQEGGRRGMCIKDSRCRRRCNFIKSVKTGAETNFLLTGKMLWMCYVKPCLEVLNCLDEVKNIHSCLDIVILIYVPAHHRLVRASDLLYSHQASSLYSRYLASCILCSDNAFTSWKITKLSTTSNTSWDGCVS